MNGILNNHFPQIIIQYTPPALLINIPQKIASMFSIRGLGLFTFGGKGSRHKAPASQQESDVGRIHVR